MPSRGGQGWFEQRLGPNVEIQWFTYNAGPSAMEAIFAGSLDLTYVGQGPALNAHFKSNGAEIRVISGRGQWRGRARGQSRMAPIKTPGRFSRKENRHTATRQHAGHLLPRLVESQGFKVTLIGGDAIVIRLPIPISWHFSKEAGRCRLDGRTVGHATGARSERERFSSKTTMF